MTSRHSETPRNRKRSWATLPIRKPLAVIVALFSALLIAYHTFLKTDIPPNILALTQTFILTFGGGYIASSTIETTHESATQNKKTEPEGEE